MSLSMLVSGLFCVVLGCGDQQTSPTPDRSPAASSQRSAASDARNATGGGPVARRRPDAPNLILITLDTVRADALGVYGQSRPTSPNIDRLAAAGVLFEQATTTNPETLPAHASLFTGRWPLAHGVRANAGYVLSDRNVTLAETLKSRGYRTAAEVAAPVLREQTQVTQGFDHYRGAESPGVVLKQVAFSQGAVREATRQIRVGSDITSKGIEFIRSNRSQAFFLWLHYFDAHDPYSAPRRFNTLIPDSPYHAEVASADHQIGRLIAELEKLGLQHDTLMVLTADHGEGLGDHDELSHSFFVYDTTMRVPLILSGLRGLPSGRVVSAPVRTIDVVPTVLELLGVAPAERIEGVSLMPLVRGTTDDLGLLGYGEATRFAVTFGLGALRFVRDGRFKYIHKVNPELYDVIADPSEQINLVDRHPERAAQLRDRLETLLAEAPAAIDDAQVAVDLETAAQLQALGYATRSSGVGADDPLASLELRGEDPVAKVDDIERVSKAQGLLKREEFEQAWRYLEPLHAGNPGSPYVLELVITGLLGLERNDEAIGVLKSLLELEPENLAMGHLLANTLSQEGRSGEASDVLTALLTREPCDENLRIHQHELLRDRALYPEMMAVLGEGATRCPDLLGIQNNYAWALATLPSAPLRDGPKAVRIIQAAIERRGQADPAYLDTLGAALAESGDFLQAIRVTTEALRLLRDAGVPQPILDEVGGHKRSYQAERPVRDPAAS